MGGAGIESGASDSPGFGEVPDRHLDWEDHAAHRTRDPAMTQAQVAPAAIPADMFPPTSRPPSSISRRAHRLLLPDARLGVRGRGRRAGDVRAGVALVRPVRGPVRRPVVAVPDRHQRLPRRAQRPQAARAAHGHGPGVVRRPGPAGSAVGGALGRADPRRRGRARRRRPGRRRGRARVDPAGVRRRAAAPAAQAASGADPARGAALAGRRGRRAARHERAVGQQRPPAGPGHARDEGVQRRRPDRPDRRRAAGAARPLRRRVRALRHGRPDRAAPRGRDVVHAAVRPCGCRPTRTS